MLIENFTKQILSNLTSLACLFKQISIVSIVSFFDIFLMQQQGQPWKRSAMRKSVANISSLSEGDAIPLLCASLGALQPQQHLSYSAHRSSGQAPSKQAR
jgi:hypothetical protein